MRKAIVRGCAAILVAIGLAACQRPSFPSKPPGKFTNLTDADLADGLWEIVPDANGRFAKFLSGYLAVQCAKFEGSAERDMLRTSQNVFYVPCGCIDRTLLGRARIEHGPLECTRSSQLMVIGSIGARLVIRKRSDSRFAGEMRYGNGDGELLGRFTLRPIDLTPRRLFEARNTLGALAEPGAIDCGRATDASSADRLYDCAAAALAKHQPFLCRYSPPMSLAGVSPATTTHAVWTWPSAYVGTSDGRVLLVEELPGKAPRLGDPVLGPGSPDRWSSLRLRSGMTRPALVRPDETRRIDRRIDGIVIVEAIVGPDGSVHGVSVLKPLPFGISDAATEMLLKAKCVPARFFGVPVTTVYHMTMRAANGQLQFRY